MVMDLTERFRVINRMNGTTPKPQAAVVGEQEQEPQTREAVEKMEAMYNASEPSTIDDIVDKLEELTKVIEAQTVELKKINKHVNATQKELKKAKK